MNGNTKQGNTVLVQYGIQTEQSDLRAHVGVLAGKVYVYSTVKGLATLQAGIQQGIYAPRGAYTEVGHRGEKLQTATGYPVPVGHIKHMAIEAAALIKAQGFAETDSTTVKGDKAVAVVQALLRHGLFSLPTASEIVTDVQMQRSGLDVVVRGQWRIQVKCDWRCGTGAPGCTGNLFLQVAECNPFGRN